MGARNAAFGQSQRSTEFIFVDAEMLAELPNVYVADFSFQSAVCGNRIHSARWIRVTALPM